MSNEIVKQQWKVRRRMAIGAYAFGFVVFPISLIFFPVLKDIAIPYYGLITFVLTAYYSWATYQDVKANG